MSFRSSRAAPEDAAGRAVDAEVSVVFRVDWLPFTPMMFAFVFSPNSPPSRMESAAKESLAIGPVDS